MAFFDFLRPQASAEDLYAEATQRFDRKDYATAVKLYEQAYAKDPDAGHYTQLVMCYINGWGTDKNPERCFEVTRHNTEHRRDPVALYNMGVMYENGFGCQADLEAAIKWYEEAGRQGYKNAPLALAKVYHRTALTDMKAQYRCYTKLMEAAGKNIADAKMLMDRWFGPLSEQETHGMTTSDIYNRGCDWLNGEGGYDKCIDIAMRWFRCAAERGHAGAWCNLGFCLVQKEQYADGNAAYLKGANLGSTTAMCNLGMNLHHGCGWPKDDEGARRFLLMARDAGDEGAMELYYKCFPEERVAVECKGMQPNDMHNRGWDLMKSNERDDDTVRLAVEWFRMASKRGFNAYFGEGTALDELHLWREALDAYLKGADGGNAGCMYIVGCRYAEGTGCEQSSYLAKQWLRHAHEHGDQRAQDKLYDLYPEEEINDEVQDILWKIDNELADPDSDFYIDDVLELAYDYIVDLSDYNSAKVILERCRDRHNVNDNDVSTLLAGAYFYGSNAGDPDYADNMRMVHSLLLEAYENDEMETYDKRYEMMLAQIYDKFYRCYGDLCVAGMKGHHERSWYGENAYYYFDIYEDDWNLAKYKRGMYLLFYHDAVEPDYEHGIASLEEIKDDDDEALYMLACIYNGVYKDLRGYTNMPKCRRYLEMLLDRDDIETATYYAEACRMLASVYLDEQTQSSDAKARRVLDKARSVLGDDKNYDIEALYGYMLYNGLAYAKCDAVGLRIMVDARINGSVLADMFLAHYGM